MKTLITGATGFIGFHLTEKLLKNGHEIFGIDNLNNYYDIKLKKNRLSILLSYENFKFEKIDISDKDNLENIFRIYHPHRVINLAAQAGVSYSISNPYSYLDSNLSGFINIVESCRNNNVKSLIYASSSSIYGSNSKIPFAESDRSNKPIALYGATKRANELIAYAYSHLYGIKTTGLRFFTVYGPWYRPDMAMYIFTKRIIEKKTITVYNNGKIKRDFTYIDDIVNGTVSAIEKNYECEIFNLGNNKSEHLMNVIKLIEKQLNIKAKINFKPMREGDMLETFADITKPKKMLNYNPKTNLEDGLPRLVDWYKEYYKC